MVCLWWHIRTVPKGPQGQKRPAEVIGNAVKVMQIATGEEAEELSPETRSASNELGSRGGKARARFKLRHYPGSQPS
jgi:hypothetical protein